jgi:hypothetical protein
LDEGQKPKGNRPSLIILQNGFSFDFMMSFKAFTLRYLFVHFFKSSKAVLSIEILIDFNEDEFVSEFEQALTASYRLTRDLP